MPMDRSKYPKDWPQISRRIRFERAGGKCEWCGVPNYARRDKDSSMYVTAADLELIDDVPFDLANSTLIILTVAHLGTPLPDGTPVSKHETMDVREENLAALCQKCHLNFDRDDHIRNRLINRRRRLVEAGQQELGFSLDEGEEIVLHAEGTFRADPNAQMVRILPNGGKFIE